MGGGWGTLYAPVFLSTHTWNFFTLPPFCCEKKNSFTPSQSTFRTPRKKWFRFFCFNKINQEGLCYTKSGSTIVLKFTWLRLSAGLSEQPSTQRVFQKAASPPPPHSPSFLRLFLLFFFKTFRKHKPLRFPIIYCDRRMDKD